MSTLAERPAVIRPSSSAEARRGPDALFLALVAAFAAYALALVWRTSFVVDGERYFTLFDDAMISMRYARNLAEGHGLVWNAGGERVEGITNPLWTFWMAALHALPLARAKVSLAVQLSSLALLVANLFVVRALALRLSGGSRAVALGAAALVATYLPLNNWALQGMEVGLAALLVSAAALAALRALDEDRFPTAAYALLGVGTFVRPDMVVPLLAVWGFLVLADGPRRRRHLVTGLTVFVACVALQTGLRVWYYGDPLPNTYYLKMTGYPLLPRITRGAWALASMAWYANPLLFLAPLALLLFRRDRAVLLLAALVAAQMAYSVYVGGDAWEWWGGANRYVSVVMPLFLVLLALALHGALAAALGRATVRGRPVGPRWTALAWIGAVAFAAVSLNALKGPRSLGEWLGATPPMHARDNAQMARVGLWLARHTPPETTVAVRWAGALPYFADRPSIDLLGKSDRRVARLPMIGPPTGLHRWVGFWPGHLKWDYAWSIGALRPDVVFNPSYDAPLLEALRGYHPVTVEGQTVYVRDGLSFPGA
ncbi:MAG TPA: hypothetical protein VHG91_15130 [Longimicrobium sp.]|nr:hypothetical protein [Longimicrobium sp.]